MKNSESKKEKNQNRLALGVIIYVLLVVVIQNTSFWIQNIQVEKESIALHENKDESMESKKATRDFSLPLLSSANSFFGLQTTFSLFSPKVSNDCFFRTDIYLANEVENYPSEQLLFRSKEAQFRWESMTHMYIDKEKAYHNAEYKLDTIRSRFLQVQKNRLRIFFNQSMQIDSSNTHLYFFEYPRLNEFPNTKALIKELK